MMYYFLIRGDIKQLPEKRGENIFKENVKCCFFWTTLKRQCLFFQTLKSTACIGKNNLSYRLELLYL